ncbi:thioredoxin domain-containing protein [Methyloferula stellata]|uniref:thioredoxin domain-containing protein n=1 Tax=Methyloferula stellata TaxID=876270 RepID=UPI001267E7C0|nr:thioredoxin domain-containing protein [Methyloferula stellata]
MSPMIFGRRQILAGALAGAAGVAIRAQTALAQTSNLFDLIGDDGKPIVNYRLPAELSVTDLPGVVWVGSSSPDVILVEFFDYNCPYCRKATGDLDTLVAKDKNFRLGLVNNAVVGGVGSVQAAKVQQAVLKLYGPARAYEFHKALFAHHGQNDGLSSLDIAKKMKLDAAAIETNADADDVGSVLIKQAKLAQSLGFDATPSFMLKGVGLLGYPGAKSLHAMIAAVRSCDKLKCG